MRKHLLIQVEDGWSSFRNRCQGSAAPFIALLINAYAWIDVIAMTPSVLDFIFRDDAQLGTLLYPHRLLEFQRSKSEGKIRRNVDPAAPGSSALDFLCEVLQHSEPLPCSLGGNGSPHAQCHGRWHPGFHCCLR